MDVSPPPHTPHESRSPRTEIRRVDSSETRFDHLTDPADEAPLYPSKPDKSSVMSHRERHSSGPPLVSTDLGQTRTQPPPAPQGHRHPSARSRGKPSGIKFGGAHTLLPLPAAFLSSTLPYVQVPASEYCRNGHRHLIHPIEDTPEESIGWNSEDAVWSPDGSQRSIP